jgi:hypothetical protein
MGGVYGEMLAYFQELMLPHDVFYWEPKLGAGFTNKQILFPGIDLYVSRNKGGKESVTTDLRTENQQATAYVNDDIPRGLIKQGLYVEDDGELFQFVFDNGFPREGGYGRHNLQLVVGNDGDQEPVRRVNLGLDEYK